MMTDPIADMLTRIRNAQLARHNSVRIPASKMKRSIAEIMLKSGYIAAVEDAKDSKHPALDITLRYANGEPLIREIMRKSRPGRRIYVKQDEIPEVLGGFGLSILSTSKGIVSGAVAKASNVGGELLCTVY